MRSINASEYQPSFFATATKSSLTSGIITPAWLRMNATANSGSRPEEQPAMIEIVPVGATVVTLQLRSFCIGRMRRPCSSRAAVSSGPQIDFSHSGNGPRSAASRSDSRFDSTSTNSMMRRPHSTPSAESYAMPRRTSASAKPITPSPMRRIRCDRSLICSSG
jgi:hypothetical protein